MKTYSNRKNILSQNRTPKNFQRAALKIAQQLVTRSIWYEDRCTWTGDDIDWVEDDWNVVHRTMDAYLYSGTVGVARFLAHCWEFNNDEKMKETAIGAIRYSLHNVESHDLTEAEQPLGLYDGMTGVSVTSVWIGLKLNEPELVLEGQQLMREICRKIESGNLSDATDVTSGYAGILLGMIQYTALNHEPEVHVCCRTLADKIISQTHESLYGCYWSQASHQNLNIGLCGYGHGASGIAHSLLEYYNVCGIQDYLQVAKKAMMYERSWYHPLKRNWPDLREINGDGSSIDPEDVAYSVYWCHGAAGIGLARLRAYQLTGDKTCISEAGAAIQAATVQARQLIMNSRETRQIPVDANLSVCHGLGSIIDLFVYAYQVLDDKEHLNRARDIGLFGMEICNGTHRQWRCGIAQGGETPGFMIGLAGIGYNYLRLYRAGNYKPAGLEITMLDREIYNTASGIRVKNVSNVEETKMYVQNGG